MLEWLSGASSGVMFILGLILFVVGYTGTMLHKSGMSPIEYFKTKDGLGILKGIVAASAVMLLAVFLGKTSAALLGLAAVALAIKLGASKKLVIGAALIIGVSLLSGCSGTYLNDATAYAGIEGTKDVSPQCQNQGIDPRGTSNLGFKLNLYESEDQRFRTNAKYTHHSCALSPDRNTYDAAGVEFEYKIWQRGN